CDDSGLPLYSLFCKLRTSVKRKAWIKISNEKIHMKKNILKTAFLALAVVAMGQTVDGQVKLPPASSSQTLIQGLGIRNVTLTYSRPNVNGRKIFGELAPYDNVWRTGANGVPKITFEDKVTIAGSVIEPGTY